MSKVLKNTLTIAVAAILLAGPSSALAVQTVVATVDASDTFSDYDAWTIINYTGQDIVSAALTWTPSSNGCFDDNSGYTAHQFAVHTTSDATGVTHSYLDASSAPANYGSWRTLSLSFTDFNPGETLVFGQDTDGSIGTTPPDYGAKSGDAFAGILGLDVTLAGGFSGNAMFQTSGTYASTATVVVPEPATLGLLGIGSLAMLWRKRRSAKAAAAVMLAVFAVAGMASSAGAAVVLTDSAVQTSTGQDFLFSFGPIRTSDGADGTFTVHARGDYTIGASSEYLTWDIDGLVSYNAGPMFGSPVIQKYSSNDVEWSHTYTINGSLLNSITGDSNVAISVDLTNGVHEHYSADPFVNVDLSYTAVPRIKGISGTVLASQFTPSGGSYGLGQLIVSDAADVVVERPSGQQTYVGGSFDISASLYADTSAGGIAAGEFRNGAVAVRDATGASLLGGTVDVLELKEVADGLGLLAGSGMFEVTDGSLAADFGAAYGEIVQITFQVNPSGISDFSSGFTGLSNITLMPIPEPVSAMVIAIGGVVVVCRRRRQ